MIQKSDFKETNVTILGDQAESMEMGVDADSMQHLMMILSTNLYQNPIGSIVREYTSNAVDANIDAKNEEPVIVRLKNANGNWYFEVEDFGTGLDDQDFRTTISKYGKSTKRDKEDQLGFYGLGCKSAFSYTNSFYYTCIKNGTLRKYLLYKNNQGFKIDLLVTEKTDRKNGVTVNIPVKVNDNTKFLAEIKTQLAYFDNVFFDTDNTVIYLPPVDLNTTFSIFSEKEFHWSTIYNVAEMHITLGRVNYPIDWKMIGINKIEIPIGLKFGLDSGLFPIPNRENLIWSDETKKLILERIKSVADWFINRYNSDQKEFENLVEAWDEINKTDYYVTLANNKFKINELINLSTIKVKELKIKGIEYIRPSFYKSQLNLLLENYKCVARNMGQSIKIKNIPYQPHWFLYDYQTPSKLQGCLLEDSQKVSGFFRDYLREQDWTYYFKRRSYLDISLKTPEDYKLKLSSGFVNGNEKESIKEWKKISKQVADLLIFDGTNLANTKEYLDFKEEHKAKRKQNSISKALNKQDGEVTIGVCRNKMSGYGTTQEKKTFKVSKLHTIKSIMCYSDISGDELNAYHFLFSKLKVNFCSIGKQDLNKIKPLKLHNFMTLKELENTKVFKKLATSIRINKIIKTYDIQYSTNMKIIEECMGKHSKDILALKHYTNINGPANVSSYSKAADGILAVATVNNLWDHSIIECVIRVEKSIQDFEFINLLKLPEENKQNSQENLTNFITKILMFQKLKYDNKLENLELCVKNEAPLDETQLVTNKINENEMV